MNERTNERMTSPLKLLLRYHAFTNGKSRFDNGERIRIHIMCAYYSALSFYNHQVEIPLAVGAVRSRVLLRGWAWAREAQEPHHRARPPQAPCLELGWPHRPLVGPPSHIFPLVLDPRSSGPSFLHL
jgi:hypothetical protein